MISQVVSAQLVDCRCDFAGRFSGGQRALYDALLHVQLECIALLRQPDVSLDRLFLEMLRLLGRQLQRLGIVRSDLEGPELQKVHKLIIIIIIIAEMTVFNVAGYLVEERRRWPVLYCFPTGTIFQINSEF